MITGDWPHPSNVGGMAPLDDAAFVKAMTDKFPLIMSERDRLVAMAREAIRLRSCSVVLSVHYCVTHQQPYMRCTAGIGQAFIQRLADVEKLADERLLNLDICERKLTDAEARVRELGKTIMECECAGNERILHAVTHEGCPDDCGHDKILLGKVVEASNALRAALARRTT